MNSRRGRLGKSCLSSPCSSSKCNRMASSSFGNRCYGKSRSYSSYFTTNNCNGSSHADSVKSHQRSVYLYRSCLSSLKHRSDIEADSIGETVGLVHSNKLIHGSDMENQEAVHFATYLKAFALIYVLPEVDWTSTNIDNLLNEGMDLFTTSSEHNENLNIPQEKPIYTDEELSIRRNFKIEDHIFTVELEPRYQGNEKLPAEKQPRHIIKNLVIVLKAFFSKARYCLFKSDYGYLLIWRRRKVYFVLDVKGRRREDLISTSKGGYAMLVCLKSLDNVVFLITNLSGIDLDHPFTLRELVVVRLVTPQGRVYLREHQHRQVEFEVVDKNYAYLKSNYHLTRSPKKPLHNRASLMVGVAAILAAKINHPATWTTLMFDQLISYGVELCRSCWESCVNDSKPINLDTFPTQLRLGQFVFELQLLPNVYTGYWCCKPTIKNTDFEYLLNETLDQYSNALFQINDQMYAIWKKNGFYYLMDPYRHTIIGSHENETAKWSTMRMFRDLESLLSVFNQILMQSNDYSVFHIHSLFIKNMADCPFGYALAPLSEDQACEVLSLNETINFPDHYDNAGELMSDTSDFEDDFKSFDDASFEKNFRLLEGKELEDDDFEGMEEEEDDKRYKAGHDHNKRKGNAKKTGNEKSSQLIDNESTQKIEVPEKVENKSPPMFYDVKSLPRERSKKATKNQNRDRSKSRNKHIESKNQISKKKNESDSRISKKGSSMNRVEIKTELLKESNKIANSKKNEIVKATSKTNYPTTYRELAPEKTTAKQPLKTASQKLQLKSSQGYPGFVKYPQSMAVAGSESGTVESLSRLLTSGFKVTDRVLTMTPWGNFVVFKHDEAGQQYFCVFDGCICNIDRFRHLDLRCGTKGLLPFKLLKDVICHMIDSREARSLNMLRSRLDESCQRFEEYISNGP